jgi:hypothetical protein
MLPTFATTALPSQVFARQVDHRTHLREPGIVDEQVDLPGFLCDRPQGARD